MSIITCQICSNQVDSDIVDCMEHQLTHELICDKCANYLIFDVLEGKLGMTINEFTEMCDLVRGVK